MIFMRIFVNNKELINKIIKSSTTEADTHPDHDHEEQHLEVHQEDLPTLQEPLKEEIKEEVKEEHHVLHHDNKRLNNDIKEVINSSPPRIDNFPKIVNEIDFSCNKEKDEKCDFSNERLKFMFCLYDRRRAIGIAPALK